MIFIKTKLVFLYLFTTILLSSQIYKDPSINIEDRISDLLSRMTIEEKIGQMQQNGFWSFNGFIIRDWGSIEELIPHGSAKDGSEVELKAFKNVSHYPNETVEVKLILTEDDRKCLDINMDYKAELGDFELFVGSSSNDIALFKANFIFRKEI